MLRQALADADDGSVDIIGMGFCNNLSDLLQSTADSISALSGLALVTAKVRMLWMVAGSWPSGSEYNFNNTATAKTTANYVVANWPTEIVFLGFETGNKVVAGGNLTFLDAADPLAVAMSDAGYPRGRAAWGALGVELAAYGTPEAAGYTTVRGTAAVNSSTGANTFTVDAEGTHRYVVKALDDDVYARRLNVKLVQEYAGDTTTMGVQVYENGRWQAADASRRNYGLAGRRRALTTTLADDLLLHLHADDLSDLSDTNPVIVWPDRMDLATVHQFDQTTWRPTKTTVGGLRAVQFGGTHLLKSDPVFIPRDFTAYALVRFATVPTSQQNVLCADMKNGTISNYRSFHLGAGATTLTPNGVAYNAAGSGFVGNAASTMSSNTWYVIMMQVDGSAATLNGGVGGTLGTGTSITGTPLQGLHLPLHLGGRYYSDNAVEMLSGFVREVRFYEGVHDASTITAVTAAMTPA